jgi:hypothetical protein
MTMPSAVESDAAFVSEEDDLAASLDHVKTSPSGFSDDFVQNVEPFDVVNRTTDDAPGSGLL